MGKNDKISAGYLTLHAAGELKRRIETARGRLVRHLVMPGGLDEKDLAGMFRLPGLT